MTKERADRHGRGKTYSKDYQLNPKFIAGVELLGRTGCKDFRIGYTDLEEDGEPVIWHATVSYKRPDGTPQWDKPYAEVAAALNPIQAVMRLCEAVIDGGMCRHCKKSTIFVPDSDTEMLDQMCCVYAWDPELETFRRGCEGD